MKRIFAFCAVSMCMMLLLLTVTAYADTGPKPAVRITFTNMGDAVCYGTLLSETDSTGPASVWDGNPEHIRTGGFDCSVWQAFVDYQDVDGYYFLQEIWPCGEEGELDWNYYPPLRFKILLYYPQTDTFAVSGIYERYAFASYFTVTVEDRTIQSVGEKAYDAPRELFSLACRGMITLVFELVIAWLFGLRRKKLLLIILVVNIVTQLALNVALNGINVNHEVALVVLLYALWEILVFAVEASAYAILFRQFSATRISGMRITMYALVANAASFIGGLVIARIIPGVF